jgi:ADP-ribosyl-[dinitrogen reductase] hydrolase
LGNDPIGLRERARGCLLGLAVGDAIGAAVEFRPRGTFAPLTGMAGGGPHRLEPGQWTDDTSMALCLGESLRTCGRFDAHDQMERYVRWWKHGYLSSTGRCFDIGLTVRAALARFVETGEPFSGPVHERSAGNGSLMRLAPVPVFFFSASGDVARRFARESSRTTHGAAECLDACEVLATWLRRLLSGDGRAALRAGGGLGALASARVRAIAEGSFREKAEHDIRGSGYVVDSLEAAAWCFASTESFRDCVLRAANLGDDADTTAAVAGQLAGAGYGEDAIPAKWRERLASADFIAGLADDLVAAAGARREET